MLERKVWKLAIAGLGHIAKYQIDAIAKIPMLELVAGYDIDTSKKSLLPRNIRFYSSLDELIEESVAEVIVVATPNETHFALAKKIVESGLKVLIEKPICSSGFELAELKDLHDKYGKQSISAAFHSAFALDLRWWLEHKQSIIQSYNLGKLIGFQMGFYDPYIQNSKVLNQANGLGGAWADSGINALSVVSSLIDISNLKVKNAQMTVLENYSCSEVQGSVIFSFDKNYHGIIDCNWSMNLNEKITTLWYENGEIVLNHSLEEVFLVQEGLKTKLKSLKNQNERLFNHYFELFNKLVQMFSQEEDNFKQAFEIHSLYFDALGFER